MNCLGHVWKAPRVSPAELQLSWHMKCGTMGTAFRSFDRLNMNQLTLSQSSPGYKGMARLTESPLVCTRYLRLQIPGAPISRAQRSAYFCDFGGRDMSVYRAKYGAMEGISRSNTCTGVVVRVQVTLE